MPTPRSTSWQANSVITSRRKTNCPSNRRGRLCDCFVVSNRLTSVSGSSRRTKMSKSALRDGCPIARPSGGRFKGCDRVADQGYPRTWHPIGGAAVVPAYPALHYSLAVNESVRHTASDLTEQHVKEREIDLVEPDISANLKSTAQPGSKPGVGPRGRAKQFQAYIAATRKRCHEEASFGNPRGGPHCDPFFDWFVYRKVAQYPSAGATDTRLAVGTHDEAPMTSQAASYHR